MPSSSIPVEATAQFGRTQGRCSTNVETSYNGLEKIEARNNENIIFNKLHATNAVVTNKNDNLSVKLLENEPRTSSGMRYSHVLWDDNLMNIGNGTLLSEASLQGKFINSDTKSRGGNTEMQPNQIISNSLDAFITAQISHP